jgi:hypothetical protein
MFIVWLQPPSRKILNSDLSDQCHRTGWSLSTIHCHSFRHHQYGGELAGEWHFRWQFLGGNYLFNGSVHSPIERANEPGNSDSAKRREFHQLGQCHGYDPACTDAGFAVDFTGERKRAGW